MPIEEAFSSVKSYLKGHDDCLQATDDPLLLSEWHLNPFHLSSVKPGSLMLNTPTNHKHMITRTYININPCKRSTELEQCSNTSCNSVRNA